MNGSYLRAFGGCFSALLTLVALLDGWVPAAAPFGKRCDLHGSPIPSSVLRRFGTDRFRSSDQLSEVEFVAGGRAITRCWCTLSRPLALWNVETGRDWHSFPRLYARHIHQVALSPDSKTVAVACDHGAYLQRLGSDTPTWIQQRETGYCVAFTPNGQKLAVGDVRGNIYLFDAKGKLLRTMRGSEHPVRLLRFSPDGEELAVASGWPLIYSFPKDVSVRLWDVSNGTMSHKLPDHISMESKGPKRGTPVNALAYFDNGKLLASAAYDSEVHICDVKTGKLVRKLKQNEMAVAAIPDGKLLALGGKTRDIRLYDYERDKTVQTIEEPRRIYGLAFSPDGKKLASASGENAIRFWEVSTGRRLDIQEAHTGPIGALSFSSDGSRLATFGAESTVRLWDVKTSKQLHSIELDPTGKYARHVPPSPSGFALFPDATGFVTSYTASGPEIFSFATGKSLLVGDPFGWRVQRSIQLSPDGLEAGCSAGRSLHFWSLKTGKARTLTLSAKGSSSPLHSDPFYSPDGRSFVTATSGQLHCWERRREEVFAQLAVDEPSGHSPTNRRVQFARDGRSLVHHTGGIGILHLFDLLSGTQVRQSKAEKGTPPHAALSPDGTLLAWCDSEQGHINLLNVFTGNRLDELRGHKGHVLCLAFSPCGRYLASGSADTTALLWDLRKIDIGLRPQRLSAKELTDAWIDLSKPSSETAYPALWSLRQSGDQAVEFLARRVAPVVPTDADRVRVWIADLDHEEADRREFATTALENLDGAAEDSLRKTLAANPSLESKRRIERLLKQSRPPLSSTTRLQALRGVQVLESIATPQAKAVLKRIAAGEPEAQRTRDARAALKRLALRERR